MWIQSSTGYKHLCSRTKFKVLITFINVPQALKHILWKEMNLIEKVLGQEMETLAQAYLSWALNVNLGMAHNPFSPCLKWRGIRKWFQRPPSLTLTTSSSLLVKKTKATRPGRREWAQVVSLQTWATPWSPGKLSHMKYTCPPEMLENLHAR